MKINETKPNAHLFICCRNREDGKACCFEKNAEALVSDLKDWIKDKGLKSKIKVSKSSCLGLCESGITACLYPQNQWFTELNSADLPNLKQMLEEYAK